MSEMTPEERTHRCKRLARGVEAYFDAEDEEFVDNLTKDMEKVVRQAEQAAYERAAMLYENIDPACDHERQNGDPGAGAMGAIIEYRDKIRALAKETEG